MTRPVPHARRPDCASRVSRSAPMTFGTESGWGCRSDLASHVRRTSKAAATSSTRLTSTPSAPASAGSAIHRRRSLRRHVVWPRSTRTYSTTHRAQPQCRRQRAQNLIRVRGGMLSRLGTDYIGSLLPAHLGPGHAGGGVVRTMDDLVAPGKIRHYALSDVAGLVRVACDDLGRVQRNGSALRAGQMEYRSSARHRVRVYRHGTGSWDGPPGLEPVGQWLAVGQVPPQRSGRGAERGAAEDTAKVANPSLQKLTPRTGEIVAELEQSPRSWGGRWRRWPSTWVAKTGPASAPFCWGATRWDQLAQTLSALDSSCRPELEQRLDRAGRPDPISLRIHRHDGHRACPAARWWRRSPPATQRVAPDAAAGVR